MCGGLKFFGFFGAIYIHIYIQYEHNYNAILTEYAFNTLHALCTYEQRDTEKFRDCFVDNHLHNHTKKYTGGMPCNIYIGSYNPVCMHISLKQNKSQIPEGLLSK